MKVLVTGGAGYIGAHTVKALVNSGHQVIVFDNLSSSKALNIDAHLVRGDITKREDLEKVFSATRFDAIMHFAVKTDVQESLSNPGLYYENNILGTINLLETARKHSIKTIVFSSSALVYGGSETAPFKEDAMCSPSSVFGKTMLVVEQILKDYNAAYGLRVVIFRYLSAAGASTDALLGEDHDPENHLVPQLINKMLKKEAFIVNGNDFSTPDGTAIRDITHVLDIAKAHVLGLEYAEFENKYEVFNLGTGQAVSVLDVIKKLEQIAGTEISIEYKEKLPGDLAVITVSIDKVQKVLGWEPQYSSLDTILQTALHWHKKRL